MNTLDITVLILLFAGLAISAITDCKYRVIKNYITFPLIIIGFVYNAIKYGLNGLLDTILAVAVIALLTLFFSFVDGIGIGDVKLYMAIASIKGLMFGLLTIAISCLYAVLGYIIFSRKAKELFKDFRSLLTYTFLNRKLPKATNEEKRSSISLAVYIFLSVLTLQIGGAL